MARERGTRPDAEAWSSIVELARSCFSAPSFMLFSTILTGWVLAPGRRTVTRMIAAGDSDSRRAHDAYHRFLRDGAWQTSALWKVLVSHMVTLLCPSGALVLDLDDTLYHKFGRKIDGAGSFRDALRSTRRKIVYATGLNLVIVTLRIRPPWGGMPIGLPVGVRLHRKGGPSTIDLGEQILHELATWLPDRSFQLYADGAYAKLAGRGLPRTVVTSRMRRDAAIYEAPPPRTGKRGRPRTKGRRLPNPADMAAGLRDSEFTKVRVDFRGKGRDLLVFSRPVLWYSTDKKHMVLLVIVRDPDKIMHDDFFFSTDLEADPAEVASGYAGRWSIECTNREVKQCLGAEDPQCWKRQGPERAASLSLWLYAAIWTWYLPTFGSERTWIPRPWYPKKQAPSFLDALAQLRRLLWRERITGVSPRQPLPAKILAEMLEVLATAA